MKGQYPEVKDAIISQLKTLRLTRVAINKPLVATIVRAHVLHNVPELLEKFKISNAWVTKFLHYELNWSSRKGTRTVHKVPQDAPQKILKAFCRISAVVRMEKIPPELIVNPDQTGVCLVPVANTTFEERGSSQVDLVGVSEKRQVRAINGLTPIFHLLIDALDNGCHCIIGGGGHAPDPISLGGCN